MLRSITLLRPRLCVAATTLACLVAPASHAAIYNFDANLNGPSESPANASPGTGFGTVDYDSLLHTMHLHLTFSGLLGTTTASHIHSATLNPFSGTAGVATTTPTFAGFPLGVTSGTYDNTLDLTQSSSWNPSFITANGGTTATAESALASSMLAGTAYWNVHTTSFSGGEIRGFLLLVPEPSAVALVALGGVGAFGWLRRRSS